MKSLLMKPFSRLRNRFLRPPQDVDSQKIQEKMWQKIQAAEAQKIQAAEAQKIHYGKAVLNNGVMPTNFSINLGAAPCNHSCLFCPQSVEKPKKALWLDLNILEKVLMEMPEENILLNISSYNETITAPNLLPAVEMMKRIRPKLPIAMASNGSIFREEVFRELMRLGLDHFSFSFDAATRDDFKTLMQKDDYDRAWGNLEKLVNIRTELQSPMKITTHIMAFKGQEKAFEKFKEYWEPKLDAVVWRRVSNWGNDDFGIEKRLSDLGYVSDHKTPEKRSPCTSIFMHFKLGIEGQYYPCVAAVPAYDKNLIEPLGHANEITWMEAWNRLAEMRQAHLAGRWDEYECCRTCNVWSMWDDLWFEDALPDGSSKFFLKQIEHAN